MTSKTSRNDRSLASDGAGCATLLEPSRKPRGLRNSAPESGGQQLPVSDADGRGAPWAPGDGGGGAGAVLRRVPLRDALLAQGARRGGVAQVAAQSFAGVGAAGEIAGRYTGKTKSLSPAGHPATLLVTQVDCSAQCPQKKQRSLGEQAVHALVADFLRASSMPYTLSVFGPESGGER